MRNALEQLQRSGPICQFGESDWKRIKADYPTDRFGTSEAATQQLERVKGLVGLFVQGSNKLSEKLKPHAIGMAQSLERLKKFEARVMVRSGADLTYRDAEEAEFNSILYAKREQVFERAAELYRTFFIVVQQPQLRDMQLADEVILGQQVAGDFGELDKYQWTEGFQSGAEKVLTLHDLEQLGPAAVGAEGLNKLGVDSPAIHRPLKVRRGALNGATDKKDGAESVSNVEKTNPSKRVLRVTLSAAAAVSTFAVLYFDQIRSALCPTPESPSTFGWVTGAQVERGFLEELFCSANS